MDFLGHESDGNEPTLYREQLLTIAPEHVCRYLNDIAFGTQHPSPESLPIKARSNTLKASKKILSVFMPRQALPWDDIRRRGNPTSQSVNALIKRVKKFATKVWNLKLIAPCAQCCSMHLMSMIFSKLVKGKLETHRICKGSTTYCSLKSLSNDNIEMRERWKGQRKQIDTYLDIYIYIYIYI
ncbi:TPA: hypothetical protein N0F65_010064 [Lagenidium giganteum]|uniref:Uncharacterized protein n=1 Tax=Lagenidium giganteum TaxID=4803 RepID=A0AAV2ZAM8_9STRA|nr:TPA: hypothetical protein N0F65_010064 [Lagenidium giganteum]